MCGCMRFWTGATRHRRVRAPTLQGLMDKCAELPDARIASISGRYFAMDRDKRWDRVQRAWQAIVDGQAQFSADNAAGRT